MCMIRRTVLAITFGQLKLFWWFISMVDQYISEEKIITNCKNGDTLCISICIAIYTAQIH